MNTPKVSEHREVEQPQPKGFHLEARMADTDAEFRQRMVRLYREMRADSESGNDADEMRETIGGVAFLVGAPLLIMVLMLLAVAHQELLTKVGRALGF
jgi:hypothetical protein